LGGKSSPVPDCGAPVDADSLLAASLVDASVVLGSAVPVVLDEEELDDVVALLEVVIDAVPSLDDETSSSAGDVASPQLDADTTRTSATTRDIRLIMSPECRDCRRRPNAARS
jgi:hypothetical protein